MFCENCRTKLNENFNFCINCGYAVNGKQPILNRETKRRINLIFKITALCFGAIISAILISAIFFFIGEITRDHIISLTNGINTGAGSSRASAIPVTDGYSSSFTIGPKEQHWFKCTDTVEDKVLRFDFSSVSSDAPPFYLQSYIWKNNNLISYAGDYLLIRFDRSDGFGFGTAYKGETYFIRITVPYDTGGTYTLVVDSREW